MARRDDLLQRARSSPDGLAFREFETLMTRAGWKMRRQKSSHRLWYSPKGFRLPIQPNGNSAKGYQVRQFITQFDKENSGGKASDG
ncbi:MAG: type II toxin-antitoxin system HicA family toxin [Candidatus Binataceae bacterium]